MRRLLAADVGADDLLGAEVLLQQAEAECAKLEVQLRGSDDAAERADALHAAAKQKLASVEGRLAALLEECDAAKRQVAALTKVQLNEVKSLKTSPPVIVRHALESIYLVLNCKQWASNESSLQGLDLSREWAKIQRMLTDDGFVQSMTSFAPSDLDSVPWVVEYVRCRYYSDLSIDHFLTADLTQNSQLSIASSRPGSAAPAEATGAQTPGSWSGRVGSAALAIAGSSIVGGSVCSRSLVATAPPSQSPKRNRKSAGLITVGGPRNRKVASEASVSLDVESVERANKACGVLVRWCLGILHEFFALQALKAERQENVAMSAAAAAESAEKRIAVQGYAKQLAIALAERDFLRQRLSELHQKAIDAETALANLKDLERLQNFYGDPRKPESLEEKPQELDTVADFSQRVQANRVHPAALAAPMSPPPLAQVTQEMHEKTVAGQRQEIVNTENMEEDPSIVVEVSQPLPLSTAEACPGSGAGEQAIEHAANACSEAEADGCVVERDGDIELPPPLWWLECSYNEAEVCKRGAGRSQQRACAALAQHLSAHPEAVVLLEGHSSGSDEDPDICKRRAEGLAAWLQKHSVRSSQIRFDLPVPEPPEVGREHPKEKGEMDSNYRTDEEEGEEEDKDEDEVEEAEGEINIAQQWPERSVSARALRRIKILEGPRTGDIEQRKQPGIFFAPEDAALDSLGDAVPKLLRKIGFELRRVFAAEGRRPIIVEGHADEGILDDTLLMWLAEQRAEAVRNFLLDLVCEPDTETRKDDKEEADNKAGEEPAITHEMEEVSSNIHSEASGRDEAGADTAETASAPVMLRPWEVLLSSRGRSCFVTHEYGRRGLNRRVEIFIL